MSDTKALSTVDARSERVVLRKERFIVRKLRKRLEQGYQDAMEIGPDGKPLTPEEVRMRVANDLRSNQRNAPVYLEHVRKNLEAYDNRQAEKDAPTQLNIGTVNIVQAAIYPAIELETKE